MSAESTHLCLATFKNPHVNSVIKLPENHSDGGMDEQQGSSTAQLLPPALNRQEMQLLVAHIRNGEGRCREAKAVGGDGPSARVGTPTAVGL